MAATIISPMLYSPVLVFTQPITYGPVKPERLASELIMAIPAAADAPESMEVGNVHRTGRASYMPKAAIEKKTILRTGSCMTDVKPKQTAPTKSAKERCHLRSR